MQEHLAAQLATDQTILDLLAYIADQRVRVDAARCMLERTDDGIGRIARRCGHGTVETFHRSFRRLTGVTPGEYRDRFRARPAPH